MKKSTPTGKAKKTAKKEVQSKTKTAKKTAVKVAKKASSNVKPTIKAKTAVKPLTKTKAGTKAKVAAKTKPIKKAVEKTTSKLKIKAKPIAKAKVTAKTKGAIKVKPTVKAKTTVKVKATTKTKNSIKIKPAAKAKSMVKAKIAPKTKVIAKNKNTQNVKANVAKKIKPTKQKSLPKTKVAAKKVVPKTTKKSNIVIKAKVAPHKEKKVVAAKKQNIKKVVAKKIIKQPVVKPKTGEKKSTQIVKKNLNIQHPVRKEKAPKTTIKTVVTKAQPQPEAIKKTAPHTRVVGKELTEKKQKKGNILFEKYNIQPSKLKNMKEKRLIEENTQPVKRVKSEDADFSIEQKLVALYSLQEIDSQIDKIRTIRGELPIEIQDLEDDVARYETRAGKLMEEANNIENTIALRKDAITECKSLIKKYNEQLKSVRNSREFDSINKEVEYQTLEIQLNEKKIKELALALEKKKADIAQINAQLFDRTKDLVAKQEELDEIVAETEKEEQILLEESHQHERAIETNLLNSYKNIRKNVRNGLAVVLVERDSCGGCFNKIPPQRQMEIKIHKKIIICEYCGRILVDEDIKEQAEAQSN